MSNSIRNFVPLDRLGEGTFASVYKVRRVSDQQIYALKKIKMNKLPHRAKESCLNEVRLLASLDSPYIVKYHESFFDQTLEALCIVMEFAEYGDLRKMLMQHKQQQKYIPQMEIWKLMTHLVQGLKLLHDNKILHRDLKCENIFVSHSHYKIGDMNVSKINKQGFVETQTGTPYYASPEVWKDKPYNQKSDIWSLGCILYEMTTLRVPFTGRSMEQLYKSVTKGLFPPISKSYSKQLANVIGICLKVSPEQRPTANQLLDNYNLKKYENLCANINIPKDIVNVQMLKTIGLPKNIRQLNQYLPKSKYCLQLAFDKENISQEVNLFIDDFKLKNDQNGKLVIQSKDNTSVIDLSSKQNGNLVQIHIETAYKPQMENKRSSHPNVSQISTKNSQTLAKLKQQPIQNQTANLQNNQHVHKEQIIIDIKTQKKKRRILKEIDLKGDSITHRKSRSKSLKRTENSKRLLSKSKNKYQIQKVIANENSQDLMNRIKYKRSLVEKVAQKKDDKPSQTKKKRHERSLSRSKFEKIIEEARNHLNKSKKKRKNIF